MSEAKLPENDKMTQMHERITNGLVYRMEHKLTLPNEVALNPVDFDGVRRRLDAKVYGEPGAISWIAIATAAGKFKVVCDADAPRDEVTWVYGKEIDRRPTLNPGDVVRLRAGGDPMTVERASDGRVGCVWFQRLTLNGTPCFGTLMRDTFPTASLELTPPRGTPAKGE